jgi:hypothetical protein
VAHDLWGHVTIGKDIKKIGWRDEEESWECKSLGVHEIIKSLLANCQFFLKLVKFWKNVLLDTEIKSFLSLEGISQNGLDILIDADEFN